MIGTIINGWRVVTDSAYQGIDNDPFLGNGGRFWCRAVHAIRVDDPRECVYLYGPDRDIRSGDGPTIQSMLESGITAVDVWGHPDKCGLVERMAVTP